MRLRRVALPGGGHSVAVLSERGWVPIRPALDRWAAAGRPRLDALEAAARDVVAWLSGSAATREETARLLEFVAETGIDLAGTFDDAPLLPFQPLTFRDFSLWERHLIDSSRALVRMSMPRAARALALYERVTGRPLPRLKPRRLWYERPIHYLGNPLTIIPDGAEVPWPSYTRRLDYELEIGFFLARPVRDATPAEAEAAIGGFALVNDWSARDIQLREMTQGLFGPVKTKSFATSLGAVVTTADEILPRFEALGGVVRVNGEDWGTGATKGPQHSLGEAVAYAARGEGLRPGELMATGTLPGCSGLEIDRWIAPGDAVELEVESLGTLTNVVSNDGKP